VKGKIDRQKSMSRPDSFRSPSAGPDRPSPDSTPSLAVSSNPAALGRAYAIYDYDAANEDEISIREGNEVSIVEGDGKCLVCIGVKHKKANNSNCCQWM
jgi:SH3 domain